REAAPLLMRLPARPLRRIAGLHQLGDEAGGVVALDLELEGGAAVRGHGRLQGAAGAAELLPAREERGRLLLDQDERTCDGDRLAAAPPLLPAHPHRLRAGRQAPHRLAAAGVRATATAGLTPHGSLSRIDQPARPALHLLAPFHVNMGIWVP